MVAQSPPRTQAPTDADSIPRELMDLPYWGVWRREDGRKIPYNPETGTRAKPNDPATFADRATAEEAFATGRYEGLCVFIDEALGVTGGDLDHVVPADRAFDEDALPGDVKRIIRIANTWACWSPSGTGVRFIFAASLGRTYLTNNKARKACKAEAYSRLRFMTILPDRRLTGTPEMFNPDPDDLVAWHEALGFPLRAPEQPAASPPMLTLDDQEIIDRLTRQQGGKAARLLAGKMGGYPSPSEARGALAMLTCFYSDDADQIARIVASSGLFADGTSDRERNRKATLDATTAVANYTGPRYNPEYRSSPTATVTGAWNRTPPREEDHAAVGEIPDGGLSRDELLAQLRAATATIARERERRVAAEARADALSHERSRVMQILRAPDLSAGQKLTAFGTVLELGARISNGEAPAPAGYRLPAYIVGEKTGQTTETVQRHLRSLDKLGIIRKTTMREETQRERVDLETGEIVAAPGLRDITYVNIPDGDVGKVIDAALTFRRPEDAPQRGGKRTPRCADHPNAEIVTTWQAACGECGVVLDTGQSVRRPDASESRFAPEDAVAVATPPPGSSGASFEPEPQRGYPVYSDTKTEPEPPPVWSPANFEPEPCVDCGSPLPPDRRYRCLACASAAPAGMPPPRAIPRPHVGYGVAS